jgi:chemotaxis protein MotB
MRRKKKRSYEEEHIDETWLIPYSDLLTLLLALFIVLFASSTVNVDKYKEFMRSFNEALGGVSVLNESMVPIQEKQPLNEENNGKLGIQESRVEQTSGEMEEEGASSEQDLQDLKKHLQQYIDANQLNAVITLEDKSRGIEVSLKDVILFDSGKAALIPSSLPLLEDITKLLGTIDHPISIEGHTDNVPIRNSNFRSNWELSSARALAVLHYFEDKGIAPERLQFTGFADKKPVFPNDTAEHRQANRRVSIIILRKSP